AIHRTTLMIKDIRTVVALGTSLETYLIFLRTSRIEVFIEYSRPKLVLLCKYLVLIEAQQHISNESPLSGVNTPRCDEDSIKLMELMVFMLRALIDENKVVVIEDVIRRDLNLNDANGVECLSNEEIFTELARMSYEKPPPS
nr:hypothetical protein [Tanacetum cinerariifolium]